MKTIIMIIALSCGLIWQGMGQERRLTKEQMYEDFDEMVSILQDCNPQLSIRKNVTGIDHMQMVNKLRLRIDTVTNYRSFMNVLNSALDCMYDIHAKIATEVSDFDNTDGIDVQAIELENQYLQKRRMEILQDDYPNGPLCNPAYINGDYYMIGEYIFIDKKAKDTIIVRNDKLIAYNGIPYSEYAQTYTPLMMRWDNKNKQYYALAPSLPSRTGTITITRKNGKRIDISQEKYKSIIIASDPGYSNSTYDHLPRYPSTHNAKVIYFEKDKILYVYLKSMDDDNGKIANEIKQTGKDKIIDKVVIDVRDNQGGSDYAWHYILQAIIADTLPDRVKNVLKNNDRIKNLYKDGKIFGDIHRLPVIKLNALTGTEEEFILAESASHYFAPDTNSLKYKGRIYIIQNEYSYSSAQAFSSYARHIDQLVSVGNSTGMLGGRGINPALFQLKHSKFSFCLETMLDITNANTPLDVFQDMPEIIINIPTEDKIKELNHRYVYDLHSKEYLSNHDYVFKKILEME